MAPRPRLTNQRPPVPPPGASPKGKVRRATRAEGEVARAEVAKARAEAVEAPKERDAGEGEVSPSGRAGELF